MCAVAVRAGCCPQRALGREGPLASSAPRLGPQAGVQLPLTTGPAEPFCRGPATTPPGLFSGRTPVGWDLALLFNETTRMALRPPSLRGQVGRRKSLQFRNCPKSLCAATKSPSDHGGWMPLS